MQLSTQISIASTEGTIYKKQLSDRAVNLPAILTHIMAMVAHDAAGRERVSRCSRAAVWRQVLSKNVSGVIHPIKVPS